MKGGVSERQKRNEDWKCKVGRREWGDGSVYVGRRIGGGSVGKRERFKEPGE